ncbi:hypothetical protein F5Y19DRAFT_491153 [Xylariaceae sp. FL1651]|nr:hypothetical protein F5Y19DRAFT_491153 [Xylariaceae sp. FL1651]
MAEAAGIALGGISLAVSVVEHYAKAAQITKDILDISSTQELKLRIFIQQKQLETTIRNLGLLPTSTEIELREAVQKRYPKEYPEFIKVIDNIRTIVQKLMERLDVDVNGKPMWTIDPPERVRWEWRRVKRAFERDNVERIEKELDIWNSVLRRCFENPDVPEQTDRPSLARVKARFEWSRCKLLQDNAVIIHTPYQGILKLPWHRSETEIHYDSLYLAISHGPSHSSNEHKLWKDLTLNVKPKSIPLTRTTQALATRSPISSTLCSLFPADPSPDSLKIFDISENVSVIVHDGVAAEMERNSISLESLLIEKDSALTSRTLQNKITMADRLALCAGLCWAVLFLSGSPWMPTETSWTENINIVWDSNSQVINLPTLSRRLRNAICNAGSTLEANQNQVLHEQTSHGVLETLGVLLIQLSLGFTDDEIGFKAKAASSRHASKYTDLDNEHVQQVYRTFGNTYGDAVRRCVMHSFSGPDLERSFKFEEFRLEFFSKVAVPIQAIYEHMRPLF